MNIDDLRPALCELFDDPTTFDRGLFALGVPPLGLRVALHAVVVRSTDGPDGAPLAEVALSRFRGSHLVTLPWDVMGLPLTVAPTWETVREADRSRPRSGTQRRAGRGGAR